MGAQNVRQSIEGLTDILSSMQEIIAINLLPQLASIVTDLVLSVCSFTFFYLQPLDGIACTVATDQLQMEYQRKYWLRLSVNRYCNVLKRKTEHVLYRPKPQICILS